jgi:hypothetical protein
MKKRYNLILVSLFVVLLVLGTRGAMDPAPAVAQTSSDPQDALAQAWMRARAAGSYRFLSTSQQTMVPCPVPDMIGQSDMSHPELSYKGC